MTQANSPNLENEIDPINQDGCHSKCIDGISISCNQILIHTAWQKVFQDMNCKFYFRVAYIIVQKLE